MFPPRLNPFHSVHSADMGVPEKLPSGSPLAGQAPVRPSQPSPPRIDTHSGKHFKHLLQSQLSRLSKPLSWTQMFKQKTFFQPLRETFPHSPQQMLKSLASGLGNPGWVPMRNPVTPRDGGSPQYPMPQSWSQPPASKQTPPSSPSRHEMKTPQKFAAAPQPSPASAEEKKAIQEIYRHFLRKCEQYAESEGYDEYSAAAMTAAELKEHSPKFAQYRLKDVKRFVKETLGMPQRHPRPASAARVQQTPAKAYAVPKTSISSKSGGASVPSQPLPPPRQQSQQSQQSQRSKLSQPLQQSPLRPQVPASATATSRTLSGFLRKWENVPLTPPDVEIEVPIAYNAHSPLGRIPAIGSAGEQDLNEGVRIAMPKDIRFTGQRQYALYAHATLLAHLHDRRAAGYDFRAREFYYHELPPVPAHAKDAAEARRLAEQILRDGGKNPDRFEARLKTLNHGLGWQEMKGVDDRIAEISWEEICRKNPAAKEDLMQMSENALASHPILQKMHIRLHGEKQSRELRAQRKEAMKPLDRHLKQHLEAWTKQASAAHPGNPQAARSALHEQVRKAHEAFLRGPLWQEDNAVERALSRRLFQLDDQTVRDHADQHLAQWVKEARTGQGDDVDAIMDEVDDKLMAYCDAMLTDASWDQRSREHMVDKISGTLEDKVKTLLSRPA
jgi:hypothetical protein